MQNGLGTSQKSLRKLTARATRWWRFSLPRGTPPTTSLKRPRRLTQGLPAGDGYAPVHRGADLLFPVCHGRGGPGSAGGFPHRLAGWGADQQQLQRRTDQKIDVERIQSEIDRTTPSSLSPASRGSTSMVTSPPWDGEGLTPPPWPWPRP